MIRDGKLFCDMRRDCEAPVTYIEDKGWGYCTEHGLIRKQSGRRCRKLTPRELRFLNLRGHLLSYDAKRSVPAEGVAP